MLFLLLLLPHDILGQECCPKKIVGSDEYMYSYSDAGDVAGFGCFDSCVYLKNSDPNDKFCFAPGNLDVICDEGETGSVAGLSSNSTLLVASEDCTCGLKGPSSRIVGGNDVKEGEWRWMAGLYGLLEDGKPRFFCGGTLVAREWIVTATHCFYNKEGIQYLFANTVVVVLGDIKRLDLNKRVPRKVLAVDKILPYPGFNHNVKTKDIALLKLVEKVNLLVYTPACLPSPGSNFVEKNALALGWGSIKYQKLDFPTILQEIEIPIIPKDQCMRQIADDMLCAGDGNEGVFKGDSGGPLTVAQVKQTPNSPQHVLAGVTSFVKPFTPGVFTDVSFYMKFIVDTFGANGGATFCSKQMSE